MRTDCLPFAGHWSDIHAQRYEIYSELEKKTKEKCRILGFTAYLLRMRGWWKGKASATKREVCKKSCISNLLLINKKAGNGKKSATFFLESLARIKSLVYLCTRK